MKKVVDNDRDGLRAGQIRLAVLSIVYAQTYVGVVRTKEFANTDELPLYAGASYENKFLGVPLRSGDWVKV